MTLPVKRQILKIQQKNTVTTINTKELIYDLEETLSRRAQNRAVEYLQRWSHTLSNYNVLSS